MHASLDMEEPLVGLPPFINGTYSSVCDYDTARSLYSVAAPILIFITIFNNVFYIILINYNEKDRNASTIQDTGIAISNTLHGLFQLPVLLYFIVGQTTNQEASVNWCNAYRIIGVVFPSIFHTASMWQLSLYGVQRFVCFNWPFKALVWYKLKGGFIRYTLAIYVCSVLLHVYKLVDFTSDSGYPCNIQYRSGIDAIKYQKINTYLSLMTVHVIPCVTMSISIGLVAYAVRLSYLRRKKLFSESKSTNSCRLNVKKTLKESLAIGLITLTLLVEWPTTIFIILTLDTPFSDTTFHTCYYRPLIISHLLLFLVYALYFPVNLVMNYELRNTLVSVCGDVYSYLRRFLIKD